VDALAEDFFEASAALSPLQLTYLGRRERQDELDDLSPTGIAEYAKLVDSTLAKIAEIQPLDDTDRVTLAAMKERLGLEAELHEAGEDLATLNNIASGLHAVRDTFDLMPMDTADNWATIAARLRALPTAISGWFESQLAAIDKGIRPATRQVDALIAQCEGWISDNGFFAGLLPRAQASIPGLSSTVCDGLDEGVQVAILAYQGAINRLREQVRELGTDQDGVGEARYTLASRSFLGTVIDLESTYRWGLDRVAELEERQSEIAASLRPGLSVAETKASLDVDPQYLLHGSEAMKSWMQARADAVIAELNGVHFDIPEPLQRIECLIAPTHDGGVYYTEPTDDFSRPGRMWWSVPDGQTTFSTWRELTTVHHEGVPGHHLQIGQAVYNRESLNSWRRSGVWVSGHGEGWALYAEQLMAELGYMDDPAMMLGMLDAQAMRAVRVVIDIGLHAGFTPPAEVGGSEWTFDKALSYFNAHVAADPDVARFEVMRYFGWPGQAPSYAIGQKTWTDIRSSAQAREGACFSLKDFHAQALSLGALGLDTLREALLG
jgi:uncharacterized protein (DUF885 family)